MANPLIEGGVYANADGTSGGTYDPTLNSGRGPGSGFGVTASIGTSGGALSSSQNTPLHVATLVITALIVVFAFRALGFRFAFDAGVGRG